MKSGRSTNTATRCDANSAVPGSLRRRDLLSGHAARNAASSRRTKLPIAVEERVVLDGARPAMH